MNLEIANRLVRLRKENHMSQEELAAKIGISRQAVSKWERAEASPDTDNLILLARIYKISLDELLSTTEPVEPVQKEMESGLLTSATDAGGSEKRVDEKDKDDIGSMWVRFPYPIFITVVYLFLGFVMGIWKETWILFVTIPLYYWLAGGIRRWLRRRKRRERETDLEVN